ncbi:MAG TPA: hypothetical protein VHX15_05000 [Frankiaceae bacterium]|jgi:hypothetical protein|nr:hypothetical protein [Frankiaceae bacterium]
MLGLRRRSVLLGISAITVAAAVAGCGDPITANHSWKSLDALVTVTEKVGQANVMGTAVVGRLTDAQGNPVLSTVFQETCVRETTSGSPAMAYRCLAIINTGPKIYVAGGMADGPFGKLTSLAGGSAPGSITITKLSGTQPANKPVLIQITATKG